MSEWRALLPKEHGAYGQLAFPLAAAYGVAGVSVGSLLLSLAVVAAFLAHEPAAIVLRQRGVRARRERGASATRRATFAISGAAFVFIGLLTLSRWIHPTVIMAAAPGLLTAAIVAARPPAPTRLRTLGWSLVGVSTLTAAIVVPTL